MRCVFDFQREQPTITAQDGATAERGGDRDVVRIVREFFRTEPRP